jgi:hypothetical protein
MDSQDDTSYKTSGNLKQPLLGHSHHHSQRSKSNALFDFRSDLDLHASPESEEQTKSVTTAVELTAVPHNSRSGSIPAGTRSSADNNSNRGGKAAVAVLAGSPTALEEKDELAPAVPLRMVGTRNEGFRCDFCSRPLQAMNMLHTESYTLEEVRDSQQTEEAVREKLRKELLQASERHEGARLCGDCSVGHCPECGTQLVPHLPAALTAENKSTSKSGR